MKRLQLAELPYHPDSSRLFDAIADDPWAVFLDSGRPLVSQGRYDIMAADPVLTLTTRGEWTEVSDGHRTTRYSDEPFALLRTLLGKHAPGVPGLPFAACLNTPACQVLSNSPERFLKVADGAVETRPIKGTRPRARHPQEDLWLAEALRHSIKDRAENLMIVDLLRNDLGKVCACGSVRVPALFAVESFATVHHLVSTVTGKLSTGRDALDLLRACFPGGSITGAPKLRAMQIIEEREPHARAVYCGSIGYIGFDGAMDTSIAIRTLVHENGRLSFSAGGGVVADSSLEAEYRETFDKAAAILHWLEQLDLDHVDRETRRQSGHF